MNEENYYWVFSAAAQAIAAFIAFLIAGVALAFSMMDRLVDRDDTLYEVVDSLKRKQYGQLTGLAIATGIAVLSSLLAVYLNPYQTDFRAFMRSIATLSDIGVVIGSIAFVASIIDPSRYSRAAKNEYTAFQKTIETIPGQEPSSVFFREFIELEQGIRAYLKKHDLYVPSQGGPRMSFSFRQMVDALYQNERISRELRDLLLEINKFRNLLFHGHMDQVDEGVIKTLRKARSLWTKIEKPE
jgi:hypothetical protein